MIAVETNILVYAHRKDSNWHDKANLLIATLSAGRSRWCIPWPCVHEFISIVTRPRIYNPPTPITLALDQVAAWMESPTLKMIGESDTHFATLSGLALKAKLAGPLIHDARIAAICLDHAVDELWTADRDFQLFPRLKTRNPLVG